MVVELLAASSASAQGHAGQQRGGGDADIGAGRMRRGFGSKNIRALTNQLGRQADAAGRRAR